MGQGASRSIQESALRADNEAIREFAARGQIDRQDEVCDRYCKKFFDFPDLGTLGQNPYCAAPYPQAMHSFLPASAGATELQ